MEPATKNITAPVYTQQGRSYAIAVRNSNKNSSSTNTALPDKLPKVSKLEDTFLAMQEMMKQNANILQVLTTLMIQVIQLLQRKWRQQYRYSCQTLKIFAWNANGLIQRKIELAQFLNTEKTDVALISTVNSVKQLM